jgi:hypothetical protein
VTHDERWLFRMCQTKAGQTDSLSEIDLDETVINDLQAIAD